MSSKPQAGIGPALSVDDLVSAIYCVERPEDAKRLLAAAFSNLFAVDQPAAREWLDYQHTGLNWGGRP